MANQLIGNSEVAIHMYQALYGQAPSNALYDSYLDNIASTSPAAFAASMAVNFNSTSDAALATQVLTNLGITATTLTATPNSTAAQSYTALSSAVVQLFAAYPTMRGQVILNMTNLFGNLEGDPTYGAAASAYNQQATADLVYASNMGHAIPGVAALTLNHANTLTTGVDHLSDTTFFAPLNGTANTLQSGDTLTGTGAHNVLSADLAAVFGSGVAPTTTNVQTISITSYDQASVTGNNTLSNSNPAIAAEVLAGLMTGVTNWVDGPAFAGTGTAGTSTTPATGQGLINPLPGSRADVVIENIQLPNGNPSSDVTSAVTFTLRNTEPGLSTSECYTVDNTTWIPGIIDGTYQAPGKFVTTHSVNTVTSTNGPNFGAYFDQQALKQAVPLQSNTVILAVGNATPLTTAQFTANPVSNPVTTTNQHPFGYSGFTLSTNSLPGQQFTFTTADIAALQAATGAAQETAFLTAVTDAMDFGLGSQTLAQLGITASVGPAFNYADQAGTARSVPSVLLSGAAGTTLTAGTFVLNGTTSGTSGQQNEFIATPISNTPNALITSNIILDNVGLGAAPQYNNYSGSTEGPVGNVVIGSLASSGGVQQFNVDVQNGSWINSLSSTNHTLQVVNITSDAIVVPNTQYLDVGAELSYGAGNLFDYASPGLLVGYNGFTDVQTINAGTFNGSLMIGETIDYEAFAIYLQGSTPQTFSINLGNQSNGVVLPGQTAAFNSVHLLIDASVASSGNFKEIITGGTGNDLVDVTIGTTAYSVDSSGCPVVTTSTTTTPAAAGIWDINQTNLKNLVINDAAGNNIIAFHDSGAAVITTGTGNDTFYIDNSGGTVSPLSGLLKAVWVSDGSVITTAVAVTAPTAAAPTAGTNAVAGVAGVETATWTAFTGLGSETISGITVTDTSGLGFTATQVATVAGGGNVAGLALTTVPGWTAAAGIGAANVLTQSTDAATPVVTTVVTGTNTGLSGAPTATITTQGVVAGAAATAETQVVTWNAIVGIGASESIDGITVTDTSGASFSNAQVATVAAGGTVPGLSVTVAGGATGWTDAGTAVGANTTLTYGTPGLAGGTSLVGTGTSVVGTSVSSTPIVSIDQYGNFTTNVAQSGGVPHTFTGAGEQVSVTFDGYTTAKALISQDVAGVTYTTAQINNAIMTEVNSDPVMNKLLHVTLGSAGGSLIISSLVDGAPVAPTITFGNDATSVGMTHTGTASGTYTGTLAAADLVALALYAPTTATGDSATTGTVALTGAAAVGTVNNSSITDTGGTNVIDLSSASGSVNTVTLTGTGTSYLINVGLNEVISTVPAHTVVINYNAVGAGAAGTTVAMGDTAPLAPVLSTAANYAAFIALALAAPANTVLYEVFAGNTFYADQNGAVVELVGTHPIAGVVGNHLVLA